MTASTVNDPHRIRGRGCSVYEELFILIIIIGIGVRIIIRENQRYFRQDAALEMVVSKYQRPSVVMNINGTFYQLKRSSVRTFFSGMC